ncbi:hypothetical protein STA3757_04600 [Stanieria sp. NIES-3757]|nr:hypothetical protein STA3757_04600 [Stanieria sp. NIES-3757]
MKNLKYQPQCIYPDIPKINIDVYKRGLKRFIDSFVTENVGNIGFYQFGTIRNPGISDIDLLIIVEDQQWKKSIEISRHIIKSDGLLSFLFIHEPVIICKSLLPYIKFFHTLENCEYIQGTWNPIDTQKINLKVDRDMRLILHVVWNSFMRVAALELDSQNIGLRRVLILMHNLLSSAYNGNKLLNKPISISLSTKEIRNEILSASVEEQQSLTQRYIQEIIYILNKVDFHLDHELLTQQEYLLLSSLLPRFSGKNIFIANNNCLSKSKIKIIDKNLIIKTFFSSYCFIKMPYYLIYFTLLINNELGCFNEFGFARRKLCNLKHEYICIKEYVKNFLEALAFFDLYKINFLFPTPFAASLQNKSIIKNYLKQMLITYF